MLNMADGSKARQRSQRQPQDRAPASWNRFYVVLTGPTNGAHQSVVKTFKSLDQTEVWSPEEADYCLVFCPVVTRVGTDVSDALDQLLSDKEAVLVVMHHTFNKEQVIPPSRRLVEHQRVKLTLDCLFHQEKLLKCEFNKKMKTNIKKFFKGSKSKGFNPLKEKYKTMEQQQSVLVQEIQTLRAQNEEKDKKIQELQDKIQELENLLKQQVNHRVKPGSSGGSVPPVSEGEPGFLGHRLRLVERWTSKEPPPSREDIVPRSSAPWRFSELMETDDKR